MRWGKLKGWSSFSGSEGAGSPIIGSIGVRRTESRREREWMNDLGVKVVFQPSGRRGRVERGISLVEASRQLGADIEALCGGKRLCGKCKVRIEEGVYQKMGILSCLSHVSAWQEEEEKFITREEKEAGFRLACCARVLDDVLIYVPEESRTGKQIVSKAARHIPIRHNPAVRLYYLEISPPSLDEPAADLERVLEEMDRQHGLSDLKIDLNGLQQLSPALRDGDWQVTLSIWMDQEIIGVRPGKRDASYGLAVDVGTTSVAGYLCNLKTMEVVDTVTFMNPQCRYGEDVMSRITYHMSNEEGLALMHREIVEGLNVMVERAVEGKIPRMGREDIEDMTLVGNTVMHHILLNLNPEYVGRVPFPPAVHRGLDFKARDLGIKIHPGAHVHLLPIEAGFVGADNVGVLIAARPYRSDEIQLIIDIGTNGELVLGNREKMICSSCATGPALEGAQLRFGMRAAAGAIERVRIDPGTHEVDYKVIGHDGWRSFSVPKEMNAKGICGSGILDVLAELFRSGIITKSGAFSREQRSTRFRKNAETGQGEFVLAWVEETGIGKDIVISQGDIRQIQLAKGALYCGCRLMMRRMGVEKVDRIKIAGAFGLHVDPEKALIMGLIPDCDLNRIESIGNAAGDGARACLLDRDKRKEAEWVAGHVEYVELTLEKDFQDAFVKAMQIPHMEDAFPHLENLVPAEILDR